MSNHKPTPLKIAALAAAPVPVHTTNKAARLELAILLKQAMFRVRPFVAGRSVQARAILDKFIAAVNPVLILRDDALPLTPKPLISVADVMAVFFNDLGQAMFRWAEIVAAEIDAPTAPVCAETVEAIQHEIDMLNKIADAGGFKSFVAVPASRGAAKHILVTGGEYQAMKRAEAANAERVEQARAARIDAEQQKAATPVTDAD